MDGGLSLPTVGAEQSDLVEWYRLETKFLPDHVRHTKHLEDSRSRRREEEWSNCEVLGKGGFSVVHKQLESSTGNCRAVKVIDKTKLSDQVDYSRELLVMAVLAKHPSLFVKFLGWFEECDTLYIAMEYLEMGDLRKNITGPLPHETVRRITKQLLEGLAVMHRKGIAHRDLKLENIFVVSMDPVWVKLGDFGISKRIQGHNYTALRTQVATRIYAAPEVLGLDSASETSEYTNAVDIWSLGCVIYELLTGEMLFSTESQIAVYFFGRYSFPKHKLETLSPAINDPEISLIKSMVSVQPNDRPSVLDLLDDTWMADLRSGTDDENDWEDQNELSMLIMKSRISQEWEKWLGWDSKLTVDQTGKQLQGAKRKSNLLVPSLVEYWYNIYLSGNAGSTVDAELELGSQKWIPGSSGGFFSPTEIFFTGAANLHPYYDQVCETFLKAKQNVKLFLAYTGVKPAPTFEQLKELQERIATEGPLSTQDLEVALYIVEQVAEWHNLDKSQSIISDFKAPDQDGVMRTFSELTTSGNDVLISPVDGPTLHPRISESTTKKLGLPTVKDRILASLSDPYFEQDFSQAQSPKAMIRDMLQQYSVERTFSEYLANAEDSEDGEGKKATRIDWMIDYSTDYPTKKLITLELKAVQGKALFCYNDGVFTDKDFKSIIDGIGSKGLDYSKIGKFGKGALTMYHWTSAPSFISGDFYVIFDPEHLFLPPLPLTGKRCGGLKLRIRDVQTQYPDQLKPFEGMFGFSADASSFEGTIFRFPFRGLTDKSSLCPKNITAMGACDYLEKYREKAKISLIFLKHISSISYWQKGLRKPIWTVSASSKPLKTTRWPRINQVEITVKSFGQIQIAEFPKSEENFKWWTIEGFTEEQELPTELAEMADYHRLEAKYGLAVPERAQPTSCFMGLPLQTKYDLSLPASINANMALQSDRQTPISEEKSGPLEGLKWNNLIFKDGIVPLYLLFLRHLMKVHGERGYRFWPAPPSELKNSDHVSLTISTEFWKKASECTFDLYPQIPPPLSTPRRSQSQAAENFNIKKVIFDFLSQEYSEFIIPLLMQLGITNIVTPPSSIMKGLIEATTDKESLLLVTPAYVRDRLRNTTQCKLLQGHWRKDPESLVSNTNKLLSFLLQDSSEDCLTGCSLLPLEGGSWGTFSRKQTSQIQYYTCRTDLERSILEITDGRLVSRHLEEPVIRGLLEKKMNVSLLSFDHIALLCRLVESKDPEYRKAWLTKIWEYFRLCVTEDPTNRDRYLKSIEALPVYCGSVVGKPGARSLRFFSPLSFVSGNLPAIIEPINPPWEAGKLALFHALNGLVLVDESTFPQRELSAESLQSLQGIRRFINAISSLPSTIFTIHPLSRVFSGVPAEGIEALSNLILPHISDLLDGDHSVVSTLKQLPIWPVLSPSFQSAEKLKLAPHTSLTLTKMIDQTTFLEPNLVHHYWNVLNKLGVPQLSYQVFLTNEVGLGRKHLPEKDIVEYQRFVELVYKADPNLFQSHNLAVNGDLRFCLSSTLYDSDVPLFQAAFRDQAGSRFLHPVLAKSRIWKDFLIKDVSGTTYIECAQSIERRNSWIFQDGQVESDSRTVFEHLCWDYQEMHSWSNEIWNTLLNIRFAPVQEATTFPGQSQLRNEQRERFQRQDKLVPISEAMDPKFEGISWGGPKPVLRRKMGSLALQRVMSKMPMITPMVVIGHLEFLSSHREEVTKEELPARISEIKKAYEYLEEKLPTPTIQESSPIWLNIDSEDLGRMTLKTFQKSWSCAMDLCLGSDRDSVEIKRVRSFLRRYDQLLIHAGVRRKISPIPIPELPKTQSSIFQGLLSLREQKLLFDVTITASLQTFQAHKIVLASASDYWRGMFTLQFMGSSTAEIWLQDDPNTIKVLLDYIYTNEFIEPPHEQDVTRQLENLLDQLEKSDKWLLPSFKQSMESYLSDDHWILPETVEFILESSRTCNANRLARVCEEYIKKNREIVERASFNEEQESRG